MNKERQNALLKKITKELMQLSDEELEKKLKESSNILPEGFWEEITFAEQSKPSRG
jgi:hypothetical protein